MERVLILTCDDFANVRAEARVRFNQNTFPPQLGRFDIFIVEFLARSNRISVELPVREHT